ncbi:MAG: hypothetical protein AAGB51_01880 [Planctomycetota bacterium]
MNRGIIGALGVVAAASCAAGESFSFGFAQSASGPSASSVASQLNLRVSSVQGTSSLVDFTFTNSAETASSISSVFFANDDTEGRMLLGALVSGDGTDFQFGLGSTLPSGPALASGDPFNAVLGFQAKDGEGTEAGVDSAADSLTVRVFLAAGYSFRTVIDRMLEGDLRVQIGVDSIGEAGLSASYLNVVPMSANPVVPVPTAAGLALAGLAGVVTRRRR